jgi:peptidoglycan/LPS O-acetylase OafA/YrhL
MVFNQKSRLKSIDSIRGVSIIFVIVDHYIYFSGNNILNPFFSYFINSKNGVDLFFIISGFLITNILVKEIKDNGRIRLIHFYLRRALRILPALYFLIFIYYILQKYNFIELSINTLISSFFLLRQFIGSGWETSHFWSLSVENIFYFLFPLILNRIKIFKFNKILFLSTALLILLPIIRYFIFSQSNLSTLNIIFRCEGLIFGSLLALRAQLIDTSIDNKYIIFSLIASTVFILLIEFKLKSESSVIFDFILNEYLSILNVFNWAILFHIIINLKKGALYFIFNNSVLIFLGVISYSIYLWQQLFFSKNDIFHFDNLFIRFICIFILSIFSYLFIECPFNKIKFKLK